MLAKNCRNHIIAFLEFIARPLKQRETTLIDPSTFPMLLSRLWFDDLFAASARYIDCLKGDYDEDLATEFRAAFNDEEWEALERFHRFFELRLEMMVDKGRGRQVEYTSDFWMHVQKDARLALDSFETEEQQGEKRQQLIREKLKALGWDSSQSASP